MKGVPSVRTLTRAGLLVFVWCALWGEASIANVASGVVLAATIQVSGIGSLPFGGLRLVPLARFAGLVVVDLFVSSWVVLRDVLATADGTAESIFAVDVGVEGRAHLLLLTLAVTVTPGTAIVDTDPDRCLLYVHTLHDERRAADIALIHALVALACEALPAPSIVGARP